MGGSINARLSECIYSYEPFQESSVARTPIELAVERGDRNIVQLLLQEGADVNASTRSSYGPLQIAAARGYFRLTIDLLEAGADINTAPIQNYHGGRTALEAAAENGRLDTVCLLIRNNSDSFKLKKDCKRAARLAQSRGYGVIASVLEDHARTLAMRLGEPYGDDIDTLCICRIKRRAELARCRSCKAKYN